MAGTIQRWFWISDVYEGHMFELDIAELYTTGNSSVVEWILSRTKAPEALYDAVRVAPTTLSINDEIVYRKSTVSNAGPDAVFPAKLGSVSGRMVIEHDSHGDKTFRVVFSSNMHFTTPKIYAETDLSLTHIPPVPPATHFFELVSNPSAGHYFRFYGEERTDQLGNFSVISWTLAHEVTSSPHEFMTVSPITCKIGDTVVYSTDNYVQPPSASFPAGVGEVRGGITIPHNTNGQKIIDIMLWVSFGTVQADQDKKVLENIALTPISTDMSTVDASIDTPTVSGHKLSLKLSESSDIPKNGSMISWSLYSTFGDPDYQYTNYTKVQVLLNKYYNVEHRDNPQYRPQEYDTVYDYSQPVSGARAFPLVAGSVSGSHFITHDENGNAIIDAILIVNDGSGDKEYTYTDILANTDRTPPTATLTFEASAQTEASFILESSSDISVNAYSLVEANSLDNISWPEWSTDGMSYQITGANCRAVLTKLTGAKTYAVKFKIAKTLNGIEGETDGIIFSTDSETMLKSVYDLKLDPDTQVVSLIFRCDVYKLNYTYSIDIYWGSISPEFLLGSKTGLTASSLGTNVAFSISIGANETLRKNLFSHVRTSPFTNLVLVLHSYVEGVETGSPQSLRFTGFITEEDSKPTFSPQPTLSVIETNGKVIALLRNIPDFSEENSYSFGEQVLYDYNVYFCSSISGVSPGPWDETKWIKTPGYSSNTLYKNASDVKLSINPSTTIVTPHCSNADNPVTIRYAASIGSQEQDLDIEPEDPVNAEFKSISTTGSTNARISAIDTRGFRNEVYSAVNIVDYSKPKIEAVTAYRNNHKLGELLFIDGNGTIFAVRANYVNVPESDGKYYIKAYTSMTDAHVNEIYTYANNYGLYDSGVQELVKEYCNNNDLFIKFTNEIVSNSVTITSAYIMLNIRYGTGHTTADYDNIYNLARHKGISSTETTTAISNLVDGDEDGIEEVTRIVTGTYNCNYTKKAEVRVAKSGESYTNNWIDVTSHITETDTTWTLECYEDPNIVLDPDYIYKLQFRFEDKLCQKPITFEIQTIPAGAPLMSFQKKMIGINNREPTAALDVYGFDRDNEGVSTHVQAYAVEGVPIVDHVIESYDSGNFHVIKWFSGRLEIECTKNFTGELSNSTPITISTFENEQYPIEFIDRPQLYFAVRLTVNTSDCNVIGLSKHSGTNTKTNVGKINLIGFGVGVSTSKTYVITVRAIGKWK